MDFKNTLKEALKKDLPGGEAHMLMAPSYRHQELENLKDKEIKPRLAAVTLLFREIDAVPHLLFIRRSDYVGIHSGQMGFPGGRWEKSDPDFLHTALRELQEEVGIQSEKIEILGQLSDLYIPPSNFLMKVFVGYLNCNPQYAPDRREVKEIHEIPFSLFLQKTTVREGEFPAHPTKEMKKAPYYHISDEIRIWGASAMALSELLEIIR